MRRIYECGDWIHYTILRLLHHHVLLSPDLWEEEVKINSDRILAFLQNPHLGEGTPQDVVDLYNEDQEFHREVLSETMTGDRLARAFGREWFNRIWWDNVSLESHPAPRMRVVVIDHGHVASVIRRVKPELILTFGQIAHQALERSKEAEWIVKMNCKHPNAYGITQAELNDFADRVRSICE